MIDIVTFDIATTRPLDRSRLHTSLATMIGIVRMTLNIRLQF